MTKRPAVKREPDPQKKPRIEQSPDRYLALKPSWRVGKMAFSDPYGWHTVEGSKFLEIKEKLQNLERMTWNEILVQDQNRNHYVDTGQLAKEAQKQLETMKLEHDRMVSLRLSGKERLWGIMSEGVLEIIWWDPDHKVYPSPKRHT